MHTTTPTRMQVGPARAAHELVRAAPAAASLALLLALVPAAAQDRGAAPESAAQQAEAQRAAQRIAERAAAELQAQKPPPWSQAERAFMQSALAASRFGVEAGRMGLHLATGPEVKNLAQKLAANHGALGRRLQELAQSRGVNLSAQASSEQRSALERLRTAGGTFDTAFVRTVGIEAQQQAVQLFEQARAESDDPQLREWIDTQLQALRDQLSEAQRIPLRHAADRTPNRSDNHATPGPRP